MLRWAHIARLAMLLSATPAMLLAQQVGFSIGRPSAFPVASHGPGLTISFHARPPGAIHRQLFFSPSFLSYPFWSSDYFYQPVVSENVSAPPQFILVQPPQESPAEPKPAQLLLIERRGDRFVRIRDTEREGDVGAARNESQGPLFSRGSATSPSVRTEALPTVLVFRDGRREETGSYTIADGVLYEAADYWSTGSWTKGVKLALLDLPATLRENRVRGVKFVLPSGPHEIVVR